MILLKSYLMIYLSGCMVRWSDIFQKAKHTVRTRFYKLIHYGEQHIRDDVKIDYCAVSLPDFLIFEEDLAKRNQAHCYYLMGLGKLGLGRKDEAIKDFENALILDVNHQNCMIYKKMALNNQS